MTITALERVHGALLGLAAGDALGATLEFMSPGEIRRRHGVHTEITGGGPFGWRPGQGTDDTDLTIAVARAYAGSGGYQLGAVIEHIMRWYDGRPRDIGGMTAASLRRIAAGEDPLTAGAAATAAAGGGGAGNGSLMRALATGLARVEPELCSREAAEISAVTHADPRCVQACVAYTAIVSALVDGAPVGAALRSGGDAVAALGADQAAGAGARAGSDVGGAAEVVAALATPATIGLTELPTTGYVVHSLAVAVWAIQQPAPLEELLVDVVNRGDDSDTTGAIAGGLLGARDGVGAVPPRWAERLEYATEIAHLAPALHTLRQG
ncbi:ADP-ribosylglycohydrolase [Parafrankia irregularis]|uniref:ADP-ribosylglycohydrolase n=1 Tax=Parafrankia irregularis TaxID=795642 RepID=A0A0S4QPP4_9ACTN|nr:MULTISPECIES: ADP-ribosylglycohydrolase family protein [Parafrankia]MBE3200556.1 ADP-ribosylglycohydrolase family protein [Parafrankia sp. CH37]CUU56888.1 ADP-ribosylglycohydrolase [Parafrankia irregularis]